MLFAWTCVQDRFYPVRIVIAFESYDTTIWRAQDFFLVGGFGAVKCINRSTSINRPDNCDVRYIDVPDVCSWKSFILIRDK